jgi:hypothetical protein
MPEFKLTLEQLAKIQEIGARLSRDPAFLAAVENAVKDAFPNQASATEQSSPEVPSGGQPRIGRTVSFGWTVPLSDDDTVPLAVMAAFQVSLFIAVGAKAAVAGGSGRANAD